MPLDLLLYFFAVEKPIMEIGKRETAQKRAIYRSWHRGTKELDFILGRFAQAHIFGFSDADLTVFERVMENEETSLQAWLMGQSPIPEGEDAQMLEKIREFHLSKSKNNGD